MDSMEFYNRVLVQRRAEETELARLCHRADREAHRRMGNATWSWPVNENDGWIKRKIGIPIFNYMSYLAR